MNNKIIECLSNPVMCKIFLEVYSKGTLNAKQLATLHPDIAQTTLYRYLSQMVKNEILIVTKETPIRGTVEKSYGLAQDYNASVQEVVNSNSGEAYMALFMQYILGFIKIFQDYCCKENINIREDISTFSTAPFYASDDELKQAIGQIAKSINELMSYEPSQERALRSIGLMITPPQDLKKGDSL